MNLAFAVGENDKGRVATLVSVVYLQPVADREVDSWVLSRKGKLGGSDVLIEGMGASLLQYF